MKDKESVSMSNMKKVTTEEVMVMIYIYTWCGRSTGKRQHTQFIRKCLFRGVHSEGKRVAEHLKWKCFSETSNHPGLVAGLGKQSLYQFQWWCVVAIIRTLEILDLWVLANNVMNFEKRRTNSVSNVPKDGLTRNIPLQPGKQGGGIDWHRRGNRRRLWDFLIRLREGGY